MSTSNLKAQWGSPPKPNLWKVEHSVKKEGRRTYDQWAVTSPVMSGAVILYNNKSASPQWWVNYYNKEKYGFPHFAWGALHNYFAHRDGKMTDAECMEHFLSERFYNDVLWKKIEEGVVDLKVPKVASSNLKAQWGDPPKPNLWKVEYDKAFTQYTIKSPVLEGHFVVKMYPPSSAEIKFFDAARGATFLKYLSPITIGDILSNDFYLSVVKPAIHLTHQVRLKENIKLANSEIKLQWGDPPKPNVWKVKERPGRGVHHRGYIFDISTPLDPNLGITIHQSPSLGIRKAYRTTFYYGPTTKDNIAGFLVSEGAHPAEIFSTRDFWSRIKDEVKGVLPLKVASSDLKAQWGSPPKTNLWKVRYPFMSRNLIEITSPIMEGAIEVSVEDVNKTSRQVVSYYPNIASATGLMRLSTGFDHGYDHILSEEGYKQIIKPAIEKGLIKIKGGVRVASSNLQAQWGTPPKPNLWKVETSPNNYLTRVTSPILQGAVWLGKYAEPFYWSESPKAPFDENLLERISLGDETYVSIKAPMLTNPRKYFLSREFYLEHLLPLIAMGKIKLRGGAKVASSNLKAQWGDPPKPNLWKVETLQRSKMVALTRVTSPVLQGSIWLGVYGAVFYCPTDKMPSPLTEEKMVEFENNLDTKDHVDITRIMGINPKRRFLSNEFYLEHLEPFIMSGRIKLNGNIKLASGASK